MTRSGDKLPTAGIGGWLLIPILVLVAQALSSVWALYSLRHHLTPYAWHYLGAPESLYFNPEGLAVIAFNAITNGLILVFALCLLWFVFRRAKLVPDLFVIFLLFYAAVLMTEQGVAANAGVAATSKALFYLILALVLAAVWVPYFRVSKRVAVTFCGSDSEVDECQKWFYMDGSRSVGPVPEVEMARLIERGRLTGQSLVSFSGTDPWVPLEEALRITAEADANMNRRMHFGLVLIPSAGVALLGVVLVLSMLTFLPGNTAAVPVSNEVRVYPAKGSYSQIDTQPTIEMMQALSGAVGKQKQRLIARIQSKPETFAPPVFCLLSRVLHQDGKTEEGAFWFYAGQLRASFDAKRCVDVSARQAVAVLTQEYGSPINQYMIQNVGRLEELIAKVLDWDTKTPYHYDHRWINLHGMGAVRASFDQASYETATVVFSLPESQWSAIADKTRAEYLATFKAAMAELKNRKAMGSVESGSGNSPK
jgi:hypothetical protein